MTGIPGREAARAHLLRRMLRHRTAKGSLFGAYASRFRGRGLEPAEVRPYLDGDEYRAIDWKVTSRMGSLHVRSFHDERDHPLWLLQDTSASMAAGGGPHRLGEALCDAAILLALCAFEWGDPVGLIRFSDKVETVLPARKSLAHLHQVIGHLQIPAPRTSRPAQAEVALAAMNRKASGGWAVLLSDLGLKLTPSLAQGGRSGKKLSVLLARDPWVGKWPKTGLWRLTDGETGQARIGWMSGSKAGRVAEMEERKLTELGRNLARQGIPMASFHADQDPLDALITLFRSEQV